MIAHIHGPVTHCGSEWVVIDVSGVGYRVYVTPTVLQSVSTGNDLFLHTSLIVREDSMTLYGFLSFIELEMFLLLIRVSRVGPALAMRIIGLIPPEKIALAIITGDEMELVRVPGVGSKSAKRLILELGDIMKERFRAFKAERTPSSKNDAILGLIALGFSEDISRNAVSQVLISETGGTTAEILKQALHIIRNQEQK